MTQHCRAALPGICAGFCALLSFAYLLETSRAAPALPPQPPLLRLTILHDNDLHGHILPYDYQEVSAYPPGTPLDKVPERDGVGGAARRATLIRRLRAKIRNPVLVIDSGDIATRGPLTTTYEGVADVVAMNAVGYDMAALGNNEFKLKDGVDQNDSVGAESDLLQMVKLSRFPWLCANAADANGDQLQGVQPYVVRLIDGVRVGFLGLTSPKVINYPQAKGWTITPPIEAAKRWIPEARRHCDLLIAVTHVGFELDKQLAAQTRGIDAIVGGDSHTFLYKPFVADNLDRYPVPIVQDGEFGERLGRFDLVFKHEDVRSGGEWLLEKWSDQLVPVGADLPEASDVAAAVAPFTAPLQRRIVGRLPFDVAATPTARLAQTTRLIADALRAGTGADFAINTSATGEYDVFRHRQASAYDLRAVLPFHDDAVIATLTSARIRQIVHGDRAAYLSGDTAALQPNGSYKVALVDFIAGSLYKVPVEQITPTGLDVRDIVERYLATLPR